MLKELSRKHKRWLGIAIKLCGNVDDANDLVQDFYLEVHRKENKLKGKEIRDSYYYRMIFNLFCGSIKNKPMLVGLEHLDSVVTTYSFDVDDKELHYLERYSKLPEEKKDLLFENYEKSMTQIAKEKGIERTTLMRELNDCRVRCLRGDYSKKYKNKRYKR